MKYDYLIVGAGFAGSVLAERLASQLGKRVLLIDRRPHFGGNAYDSRDTHGILIHNYGPHLFHTNDKVVFDYLGQFTSWLPYEHRVRANVQGRLYPVPINRTTLNMFYGMQLNDETDTAQFLDRQKEHFSSINNSEEIIISQVGRELFEAFYKGYTKKQWMQEPKHLSPGVCGRIPVRLNTDDRYFTDAYQAMPASGYGELFRSMLSHPNIDFHPGVDFSSFHDKCFNTLIYTGPIDEYFGFMHGHLPYRSLRFEHETHPQEYVQETAQVNYCDEDVPYTRTCEWKHCTGQKHPYTSITREFPEAHGEPLYPIPTDENHRVYELYKKESIGLESVVFAGRLAEYRYYNMDQVVARTLKLFHTLAGR